MGNGPYKLVEWVPGSYLRGVKSDTFYGKDNLKIDEISWDNSEDLTAALNRYRAGEFDILTDFPADQYKFLQDNYPGQAHVAPFLGSLLLRGQRRKAAARQRQCPQGAVDGDHPRRDRARTCWARANCRPMAGCRRAPPTTKATTYHAGLGEGALRTARRGSQEADGGRRLHARQSAEAAAALQHQRQPPAHRRRHLAIVEADRRRGRAVQRRDAGALRRPAGRRLPGRPRRLAARLLRCQQHARPAARPASCRTAP